MRKTRVLIGCLLTILLVSSSTILRSNTVLHDAPQRYFPFDRDRNVSITPTLVWLAQEGADYYQVWIEGTSFSEICYGTYVTVPKEYLLEGNYYKWRIQSFTKDGMSSPPSSPWTFRTQYVRKDLPEEPILSYPFYDQMDVSLFTDFTWYGGSRASGYILILREANEERTTVWNSGIIQSSTIQAPYGVLERHKRYAWSMISVNEKGYSPESSPLFFYTKE